MNQNTGGSFLSAETLDAIIDIFVEEAPQQVLAIEEALARHDFETVGSISHKLRGSTEFLGTSTIASLATDVENAAKLGDVGQLESRVPKLLAEVRVLLEKLNTAETG